MERRGIKRPFADDDSADVQESRTNYRKMHLDRIYNLITVDGRDRKASKALVHSILKDMLAKVHKQEGGHIYKQLYVDAGSHPVRAKIGTANEFDVNIPMTIQPACVMKFGLVPYQHIDFNQPEQGASTSTMTKDRKLVRTSESGYSIPVGYCVVSVDNESTLPAKFIHRNELCGIINRSSSSIIDLIPSSSRIDLIPYDVKLDLYEKLSKAKNTDKMSLCRSPSGPALTLTIKPQGEIKHIINLDVTASIVYSIPLLGWIRWPRLETGMAFDSQLIKQTKDAGTHLVPKKDLFWAISFSRMERALLAGMDGDGGCRKFVYKMLKKYVEDCKSKADLPGISSHILKTQVLWSCETHANNRNYWKQENRDICLMNTMQELEKTLISGTLKDYFHDGLDVLRGKDQRVLLCLARFIETKRSELQRM